MSANFRWALGKAFEGLGLVVVLWGLAYGMVLGMREEGLRSMSVELGACGAGVVVFLLGRLLERSAGRS
ncbi:MAG: hypothetical protein ACREIU_05085 [Planctomycetota bacterium]